MASNSRLRFFLSRVWLVALLAMIAGLAAWSVMRNDPDIHERTLVFVLRPGSQLADDRVPGALDALADPDGALSNTVASVLSTERLLLLAAQTGGTADLDSTYTQIATVRPGSNILDITFQGTDPDVLTSLARAFSPIASDWVSATYRAYRLEFLDSSASTGPVAPKIGQRVTLAALLGALAAIGVVFVEWKARHRRVPADGAAATPLPFDREGLEALASRLEQALASLPPNGAQQAREADETVIDVAGRRRSAAAREERTVSRGPAQPSADA